MEQEARDKVSAERAALWQKRKLEEEESAYSFGMLMRVKAREMMRRPLQREVISGDGKTIEIIPAKWTFATACALAKTSFDLVAMAIGDVMYEEDAFDPLAHTPEECQEYLDKQKARRKAIREAGGIS